MKIDPTTPLGSRLIGIAAWLGHAIVTLIGRTCRIEIVEGRGQLDALCPGPDESSPAPVLISFWHNRSILAAPVFARHLVRRGADLTVLASQSRDGELVGRLAGRWRMRLVRGSATRGGSQALRRLYRLVRKERTSPIMIPDGPHGPIYEFKVGVAVLAQMAQAPILPMGFAVSRAWRVKSWDRLMIPKPFARLVVVVGEPQPIERGLDADALEAERQRLEALVTALTDQAEAALAP